MFIEHMIGPDTTGHELGRYVSDMFHTHDNPNEFHGIRTQMGISHAGPLPAASASSAPDDVVLTLGRKLIFTFEGRTQSGTDNTPPSHESFTLSAPADAVIRRHDRYDKSGADGAIDWESPDGNVKATVYLLRDFTSEPGSTAENEFRLCMGMYRNRECTTCPPLLNGGRDVCTTWQVPNGWQAGQPLVPKNMFVTERRDRYPHGGSYTAAWYTIGPAPFDDTVNTDVLRWKTRRPISFWGVSGALFSTMLDSTTVRGQGMPAEVEKPLYAVARLNRHRQLEGSPSQLVLSVHTRANPHVDGTLGTVTGYSPVNEPMRWSMRSYGHNVSPPSQPDYLLTDLQLTAEVRPVRGRESLVLDRYLTGELGRGTWSDRVLPPLKSTNGKALAIARDALVPFGTVRTWRAENADKTPLVTSMELRRGPRPRQADLCLRSRLPKNGNLVNRLSCVRWAVPAGWRHGQGLKAISAYVVDRSLVSDEKTGTQQAEPVTRMWQSFAKPAEPAPAQ
ncbi:MAG: hypothetical protein Q4D91_09885 [Lautropia sp.]|nr:hypothetical protein [Lautropia sp.]